MSTLAPVHVFDRILVAVDGGKQGFDACRQAARLARLASTLEAATVIQLAPGVSDDFERLATATLAAASRVLGPRAETRQLYGLTVPQLLDEAERMEATLVAIGSHGHPRLEEILLGGVAGEVLHEAPCSVLIARPAPDLATFPHSIVVGLDGSEESELAYAVARSLATRRHGSLQSIVALGGKHVDLERLAKLHSGLESHHASPVHALVDASSCADLLVVGSRGLHGLRALGSVSERVAHEAGCSVLVVRAV